MTRQPTVYVRLLDEDVDVWRPVPATFEGSDVYRLSEQQPDGERWEFRPGSRVHCKRQALADGEEAHLVARAHEAVRQAGEVRVTITAVARSGDTTRTDLRLDDGEWPFEPVAPAMLCTDDRQPVIQLHKLLRLDDNTAALESYELAGEPPRPGGQYLMFSWLNPKELSLVTDNDVQWHRRIFNKGDHTHCLLTFDEIERGTTAYQADDQGWVTVDAWEEYIRDDVLRLRRPGH